MIGAPAGVGDIKQKHIASYANLLDPKGVLYKASVSAAERHDDDRLGIIRATE